MSLPTLQTKNLLFQVVDDNRVSHGIIPLRRVLFQQVNGAARSLLLYALDMQLGAAELLAAWFREQGVTVELVEPGRPEVPVTAGEVQDESAGEPEAGLPDVHPGPVAGGAGPGPAA